MILYNPYTRKKIDYPLDLSDNNIVLNYHIEHETFFCPWFSTWLVANLETGDVIYIPYGEKNRRDIYVVTSFYLDHTVTFPRGVYILKYSQFLAESGLKFPDYNNLNGIYNNNGYYDRPDKDDDDDYFDDSDIINSIMG